jgi:hypothetical protein
MLVLLIFAPTIASSSNTDIDSQIATVATHLSKKNASHSQSDLQLTYEEREKEEESCGAQKSKQSLLNKIPDIFTLALPSYHYTLISFAFAGIIPVSGHLYLIKRSLRI